MMSVNTMPKTTIEDLALTCQRCGHVWLPRKAAPDLCPKCKSYLWCKNPRRALHHDIR